MEENADFCKNPTVRCQRMKRGGVLPAQRFRRGYTQGSELDTRSGRRDVSGVEQRRKSELCSFRIIRRQLGNVGPAGLEEQMQRGKGRPGAGGSFLTQGALPGPGAGGALSSDGILAGRIGLGHWYVWFPPRHTGHTSCEILKTSRYGDGQGQRDF